VVPVRTLLPLGADGDLERTHLRNRVDAGEVEGERGESPALVRIRRGREVAVPGLVDRPREGDVETDLDDLVVRPEHRLRHRRDPGMGDQIDEAAQLLGVDLDVVALRPATHGSTGAPDGLVEGGFHVRAYIRDPCGRECASQRGDPVGVQAPRDLVDIEPRAGSRRHGIPPGDERHVKCGP
jgi:hypothetical protein